MLKSGLMLIHDNARLHTGTLIQALLQYFSWELFDHPPYNPYFAPTTTTCLPT
jgi:hypothetical protein